MVSRLFCKSKWIKVIKKLSPKPPKITLSMPCIFHIRTRFEKKTVVIVALMIAGLLNCRITKSTYSNLWLLPPFWLIINTKLCLSYSVLAWRFAPRSNNKSRILWSRFYSTFDCWHDFWNALRPFLVKAAVNFFEISLPQRCSDIPNLLQLWMVCFDAVWNSFPQEFGGSAKPKTKHNSI